MSSVPTLSIWQDSLLCGQSLQRGQSVLVPHAPPPRKSSPAGHAQRLPCTRAWFCDQGSWGRRHQALVVTRGNPNACPKHLLLPQLRRSPIKKVRKSLALDIVDEDMKLMMSALPKALPLVRGLGEKPSCEATCYSPRELQEAGGMESPWGPSPLEPFSLERTLEVESGDSRAGLPRAGLSREGAAGHHPPGFRQPCLCLSQKGLFGKSCIARTRLTAVVSESPAPSLAFCS